MTSNISKQILKGLAAGSLIATFASGCGSTQSPGANTASRAGGRGAGGDSSDPMAVLSSKEPARKVSEQEREDFDKALATYQDLKKDGKLDGSECDKAATAFERAASKNPNLREAKYNVAAVYMECGREKDAVRTYEQMANGTPPYAPAITSLGYLAWKAGRIDEAERMFNRAIELDQQINSVAARNDLSQILRDKVQKTSGDERNRLASQAINHLRRVLALDGNNIQAYATYSALYNDMGYLEMARLVGQQAVKRAEEIATGKFEDDSKIVEDKGGGGKGRKGKDAEPTTTKTSSEIKVAGTGYTAAMKGQLALVYNTLGLVDLKEKKVTTAIANFRKSIELDPGLNEARMNLAALSLNFRDYKTAEENFRAVLQSQPRNFEAAIGLGVALRGGKKIDDAEQQYVAAQKIDPQNPQPYFNLGLLYQDYRGGERTALQKAQQHYRDFLTKANASTTPPKQRRDAEKRIKDIDEMFKALDEAEKMQKEAEEMQRKAEEQQKKMEVEMKKMQEQEAAAGAGKAGAATPATAPPPAK